MRLKAARKSSPTRWASATRHTFIESATYWKAPNEDKSSVILSPWLEANSDTLEGWHGETTLAYKRVVYRDDRNIVAFQGGALWVSHPGGCSEGGGEVRVLAGRGVGDSGFLNVEAAGRVLSGGCAGARFDIAAGYRPLENWLALGQVFLDAPVEGDDTVRGQLSLVRFGKDGRGVQVGLRARIDGGAPEPTLVIGLWRSAGRLIARRLDFPQSRSHIRKTSRVGSITECWWGCSGGLALRRSS